MTDGGRDGTTTPLLELGLPEHVAAAAAGALGPRAVEVIATDPWAVLAIPAVRPEQADAYARSRLGPSARRDDQRRQVALLSWLLVRAALDGHTVLPTRVAAAALAAYELDAADAIAAAVGRGAAQDVDWPGGGLALPGLVRSEQVIADAVRSRLRVPSAEKQSAPESAGPPGIELIAGPSGSERDAALHARIERARAGGIEVLLTAPTLGGATRLARLTAQPAFSVVAATAAVRSDSAPSPGLLVVDDADALDVESMAALLQARGAPGAVLTIDPSGLAPVDGPGDPARDLAASLDKVDGSPPAAADASALPAPVSTIADLVDMVGRGVLPRVESPAKEVVVVPATSAAEAVHRTVQLVTDAIPRALGIRANDVMILTPAVRGVAGAITLNAELKSRLNPGEGRFGGFDIGDRVALGATVGQGITGDVGAIVDGGADHVVVDVDGVPVQVPAGSGTWLRSARALTVARARAGRWPAVVVVLPGESAGYLCRALVRTAFSRAERHLSVVHAAGSSLARAVTAGYDRRRRTMLPRLL